jgi:uncharacterized protein YkwD
MDARSAGRSGRRVVALVLAGLLMSGFIAVRTDANAQERHGRRRHMVALTNEDRVRRDRDELSFVERVSRYARQHSAAMAVRGQIFHSSADQIRRALDGRRWSLAGENVGVASSLEDLQGAFMSSKLHRQNILRPEFSRAAVGVVKADGRLWVTVIFYG